LRDKLLAKGIKSSANAKLMHFENFKQRVLMEIDKLEQSVASMQNNQIGLESLAY